MDSIPNCTPRKQLCQKIKYDGMCRENQLCQVHLSLPKKTKPTNQRQCEFFYSPYQNAISTRKIKSRCNKLGLRCGQFFQRSPAPLFKLNLKDYISFLRVPGQLLLSLLEVAVPQYWLALSRARRNFLERYSFHSKI